MTVIYITLPTFACPTLTSLPPAPRRVSGECQDNKHTLDVWGTGPSTLSSSSVLARAGSPRVPFRSAAGRARLGESNLSWTVQNSGAFSSLLLMDIVSVVYGYIPGIKQSAWHKDSLTTSLLKKPKMLLEMSTLP